MVSYFSCLDKSEVGVSGSFVSRKDATADAAEPSAEGVRMLICCQKIRGAADTMLIELRIDTEEKRQLVSQRFTEWGYRVISLIEAPAGERRGIFVRVTGNDREGIIDRMCNDPAFDVKC